MERNVHVHDSVRDLCLPKMETFQVPSEEAGEWALNGKMLLPPQFNADKKYSVLVYVYGGPNSQTVSGRTHIIVISLVCTYFCAGRLSYNAEQSKSSLLRNTAQCYSGQCGWAGDWAQREQVSGCGYFYLQYNTCSSSFGVLSVLASQAMPCV